MKVENWVTFKIILFSTPCIANLVFLISTRCVDPFNNFQIFQTCIGLKVGKPLEYQARDLVVFLPENNVLLIY